MGSTAFLRLVEAALEEEAAEEALELELDALALEELDDPPQPAIPSIPQAIAPAIPSVAIFFTVDDFSISFLSRASEWPHVRF